MLRFYPDRSAFINATAARIPKARTAAPATTTKKKAAERSGAWRLSFYDVCIDYSTIDST
jgi:hypothetical protein